MAPKFLLAYNGMDTGLGNRVRVVLSAQILAELEDRRLLYVWPTGPRFGPRFTELFDFSGGTRVPRSVSRVLARRYSYEDASLTWLTEGKRRERLWQVRTGAPLELPQGSPTWGERLRGLRAAPELAGRIGDLFAAELSGQPYVGVMIRAHAVSHPETRLASPVEWFLDRMRAVREQSPTTRFFVSCDVPEVQDRVCDTIGGCVGQRDKGGYNTTAGIKSAVVDLYLLAGASHLIAPHYSSFIHMAQHLGGDLVPIETSRTETPGEVDLGLPPATDPLRPWLRFPNQKQPG